jgi:polysaccharide biosynthesis/export protein
MSGYLKQKERLCRTFVLLASTLAAPLCLSQEVPGGGNLNPNVDQSVENDLQAPAILAPRPDGQQITNQPASRSYTSDGINLQEQVKSDRSNRGRSTEMGGSDPTRGSYPIERPTEFQRVVETSTGLSLPIYGAQLFRNAPTTFAPLEAVPVPAEYVLGPGDELSIQIWGQVALNSHFVIDRSGDISLPQVGTLRVAGLHFDQLQGYLKDKLSRIFRNFDLSVNLGQLRSIQILVLGQARKPGTYTVSSLSTLVDALFATGGATPQGSLRHVHLVRDGKVAVDFDLYALLLKGDKSKDVALLPGDIIFIPIAGPQVAVAGSVNSPAIYELDPTAGATVGSVLQLAAGPNSTASKTSIRLERITAHGMRSVLQLSQDEAGLSLPVQGGDILELTAVTDRYQNGVTLRGNVANPGHYGWNPGMRVRDLFPDRDALVTRDYWLNRGRLGMPVLSYEGTCFSNSPTSSPQERSTSHPEGGGLQLDSRSTHPFRNCLPPLLEHLGDQRDPRKPDSQSLNASSTGSPNSNAASLGSATIGADDTGLEANDVKQDSPDIDWSYAVIERQDKNTLSSTLIPFNLGRLVLDSDETQNIELQPSDVVTIFSKADIHVPQSQQTRYVRLEGEFVSAGIYSAEPGETLPHLVQRAGGVTSDAYLFGSEFTRISTQRLQQKRLDEYIEQISIQASANSANVAGRNVSALDTASAIAMQSQNQSLVNSLRHMRASGRIVLNLKPETSVVEQLPDLALEDGDVFIVPHKQSTVGVAGAVYSANTFLYVRTWRVADYLKAGGGPNRDADSRRTYLIRADGSIVSRQQMSSFHRDSFDSLAVFPGDSIVVPLNVNKGAGLRNVVDIAQIFGQFGIALAAANVIF